MSKTDNLEILKGFGIPNFKAISEESIEVGIPILLDNLALKLKKLEIKLNKAIESDNHLSWIDVMPPLHQIGESLRWSWGAVSHLNGVNNNETLRNIYAKLLPQVISFSNKISQNKVFYKAFKCLYEDNEEINQVQKRILKCEIQNMKNTGISLDKEMQIEFNNNSQRLAELSTNFSNNVLDSTNDWSLILL